MNLPLVACFAVSLFIVVARGPLIFAPEATMTFYMEEIFAKPLHTRAVGAVMLGMAALLVMTMSDSMEQTFPLIMFILGLVLALGGVLLIAAPGFMHELVSAIASMFAPLVLRAIGLVSVGVAVLIGYFGVRTFG